MTMFLRFLLISVITLDGVGAIQLSHTADMAPAAGMAPTAHTLPASLQKTKASTVSTAVGSFVSITSGKFANSKGKIVASDKDTATVQVMAGKGKGTKVKIGKSELKPIGKTPCLSITNCRQCVTAPYFGTTATGPFIGCEWTTFSMGVTNESCEPLFLVQSDASSNFAESIHPDTNLMKHFTKPHQCPVTVISEAEFGMIGDMPKVFTKDHPKCPVYKQGLGFLEPKIKGEAISYLVEGNFVVKFSRHVRRYVMYNRVLFSWFFNSGMDIRKDVSSPDEIVSGFETNDEQASKAMSIMEHLEYLKGEVVAMGLEKLLTAFGLMQDIIRGFEKRPAMMLRKDFQYIWRTFGSGKQDGVPFIDFDVDEDKISTLPSVAHSKAEMGDRAIEAGLSAFQLLQDSVQREKAKQDMMFNALKLGISSIGAAAGPFSGGVSGVAASGVNFLADAAREQLLEPAKHMERSRAAMSTLFELLANNQVYFDPSDKHADDSFHGCADYKMQLIYTLAHQMEQENWIMVFRTLVRAFLGEVKLGRYRDNDLFAKITRLSAMWQFANSATTNVAGSPSGDLPFLERVAGLGAEAAGLDMMASENAPYQNSESIS